MNFDDFFLIPFVISQRLPQLWFEAVLFDPFQRRESERMVTEKIDAAAEGMMAAHAEFVRASIAVSSAMLTGRSPVLSAVDGAGRVARAAIAPGKRRLHHNARRLAGRDRAKGAFLAFPDGKPVST